MGGAAAIYSASKTPNKIRGLIAENTFTSMVDEVNNLMPFLKLVSSFLIRNKWPSKTYIESIKAPILFIKSGMDELVPVHLMNELYDQAKSTAFKTEYFIKYGDHN